MLVIQPNCASRRSMFCPAFAARCAAFASASAVRLGQDRRDQEQHLATVGIATALHHLGAHVVAVLLHLLDALDVRHDRIGIFARQRAARDPIRRPARSPAGPADTGPEFSGPRLL